MAWTLWSDRDQGTGTAPHWQPWLKNQRRHSNCCLLHSHKHIAYICRVSTDRSLVGRMRQTPSKSKLYTLKEDREKEDQQACLSFVGKSLAGSMTYCWLCLSWALSAKPPLNEGWWVWWWDKAENSICPLSPASSTAILQCYWITNKYCSTNVSIVWQFKPGN